MLVRQMCKKLVNDPYFSTFFTRCADGSEFQGDHKLVGRSHRAIGS